MRQVIVFETRKAGDGITTVTGVFWFPIAAVNARVPFPGGFGSVAQILTGAKAITPQEQADLDSGAVREEQFSIPLSASNTTAQLQAELQRRWTDRKAALDASPPARQYFGASWDGASWSA